jgi:hypothetical protein
MPFQDRNKHLHNWLLRACLSFQSIHSTSLVREIFKTKRTLKFPITLQVISMAASTANHFPAAAHVSQPSPLYRLQVTLKNILDNPLFLVAA